MPRKPFPWKIGADPEFSVLLDGRRCNAKTIVEKLVIKDKTRSEMGFKSADMKGEFGWDGCQETGELRPNPATSADELTSNIGSILTKTLPLLSIFDFSTLSIYAPIGGHIHFDLPT